MEIDWARSIQPKFPEISVQNSMDRFGPTGKVSKKKGPPFEVDHFSRSDRLEFWLNGSRPEAPTKPLCMVVAQPFFLLRIKALFYQLRHGILQILLISCHF